MLYEAWLQFRGEAGQRQLPDPHTVFAHNLGGWRGCCVSFVSVVSRVLGD
jgi:acetyl-CoA C-acetyltransferase